MKDPYPKLTAREHAQVAWCVARMAKRSVAGEHVDRSDLERKVDGILDGARKRAEQAK
ncbi:hypothetical protein GCM10010497_45930 [Streptomyces cinereoruber]|uniref:Uncharacterized protein n=1 Tax=Streptomyces cinereoruber TaxID=67260 RepID=A0AAV4KRS1_9ACTN|nr:DUF6257 family protein [Streptomyces cinereoruber]MBB4160062.1 hypothetical protein [Streptomyces cinereoruber]MBY8818327.1 DUF6257 family protein [Streptomyces cinereoruber]NIH61000.1 hypothetical protein [Streptomyces cinereoruber]GGR37866.1 hypothetical protein GCM10010497_45930 [Streptomyces cinereoruber]